MRSFNHWRQAWFLGRGQQHIQVGRADEIKALPDLERITDGGSAVRFVIGEYGSGKTFFLHLVRSIALERGPSPCMPT